MREQRNDILNNIHKKIHKKETDKISEKIEEIENHKEVSNRMFQVVKQLQIKDKDKILVTASEKKQVEIITNYFREVFRKDSECEVEVKSVQMRTPSPTEEISKAVRKLKNNKSSGIDEIGAELIKHSQEII